MKHINTHLIVLLLPVFAFIITLIILKLLSYSSRINYKTEDFSESTESLKNPYCGFYHIIGYTLSDDYTPASIHLRQGRGFCMYRLTDLDSSQGIQEACARYH